MSNFKSYFSIIVIFLLSGSNTLFAHPGHGTTDGHSLIHYLTEPLHIMVFVAVVVMIASSATWFLLRKKKKQTVEM